MGTEAQENVDGSAEGWRDSHGKRLVDYPRPSLAVDVAVLTVLPRTPQPRPVTGRRRETGERGVLAVVVHRRDNEPRPGGRPAPAAGSWALPGTFLHDGERLADAARRALHTKCGIDGLDARQLRVFDDPARDPRGWVVSVAHWDVVPYTRIAALLDQRADVAARLVDHEDTLSDLAFDHQEIVARAVAEIRATYSREPDPAGLLAEPFTLLQLRQLHEAVLGEDLQKDTFRRKMEPYLAPLAATSSGTVGRPAQLYRRIR